MSETPLIRLLIVLALLLAPLMMIGSAPADAAIRHGRATSTSSDCASTESHRPGPAEQPFHSSDCMTSCAATLPDVPSPVNAAVLAALQHGLRTQIVLNGLAPEAATPPPRAT